MRLFLGSLFLCLCVCVCPLASAAPPKAFTAADFELALKFFSDGGYMSFRYVAPGGEAKPMVLVLMHHDRLGKISEIQFGSAIFGQDGTLDSAAKVVELNGAGYATLRTFLRKFAAGMAEGKFAALKLNTTADDGTRLSTAGAEELSPEQLLQLAGDEAKSETTATPAKSSGRPPAKAAAVKNRTWVDVTGKHRTVAKFVDLKDGRVRLKKSDGKTITLPLEQLSEADRQYVNDLVAAEKQSENESNSVTEPAAEDRPSKTDNVAGPPKKGRAWSNVNDVDVNGEKRRAGKRFTIRPTSDEPLKIEGGKLTVHLQWQTADGQEPPGEPKEDGINLHLFIVGKMARILRGQAVTLVVGANQGEVERTESLEVDLPTADVFAYFSRDSFDLGKAKVVSTPLSNIVRIKAVAR